MSLFDSLTSLFAPHDCLGCGTEGALLCSSCVSSLVTIPERCFRCRKLMADGRCCHNCQRLTKLHSVSVVTVYDGPAKALVWQLKFHGAQAAARLMSQQMADRQPTTAHPIIVHVPTATERIRQRGYDQAQLLARALHKETRLEQQAALVRIGQHHQVGAHREQRLTQLAGAFRVTNPDRIRGRPILLIDDVLTTGATLSAAARTLKAAGAGRIDGLVFAQA
jgi:competence protein ComFC